MTAHIKRDRADGGDWNAMRVLRFISELICVTGAVGLLVYHEEVYTSLARIACDAVSTNPIRWHHRSACRHPPHARPAADQASGNIQRTAARRRPTATNVYTGS